jgi:hypothetical protein
VFVLFFRGQNYVTPASQDWNKRLYLVLAFCFKNFQIVNCISCLKNCELSRKGIDFLCSEFLDRLQVIFFAVILLVAFNVEPSTCD